MQKLKQILLATTFLLICAASAIAQGGPGFDDDTDDAPLDGGVSAMIVATAAYGAKKLKDKRKEK